MSCSKEFQLNIEAGAIFFSNIVWVDEPSDITGSSTSVRSAGGINFSTNNTSPDGGGIAETQFTGTLAYNSPDPISCSVTVVEAASTGTLEPYPYNVISVTVDADPALVEVLAGTGGGVFPFELPAGIHTVTVIQNTWTIQAVGGSNQNWSGVLFPP